MEELQQFEQQLHDEYRVAIEKELPRYLKDRKTLMAAEFLNATACLVVPPWGVAASAKDLVVSGLELAGMGRIASSTEHRIRQRLKACDRFLDRTELDGKPILLEFVKRMQKRYAEKMLGA